MTWKTEGTFLHPSSPASPNECTAVMFGHNPFGLGYESHLHSTWLHFAAFPQLHDVTSLPFPPMNCSEDAAPPLLKVHPEPPQRLSLQPHKLSTQNNCWYLLCSTQFLLQANHAHKSLYTQAISPGTAQGFLLLTHGHAAPQSPIPSYLPHWVPKGSNQPHEDAENWLTPNSLPCQHNSHQPNPLPCQSLTVLPSSRNVLHQCRVLAYGREWEPTHRDKKSSWWLLRTISVLRPIWIPVPLVTLLRI